MVRASSSSYQLPRPSHTIKLRTDRENYFRVDMINREYYQGPNFEHHPEKKDYQYLGSMTATDIKREIRQLDKEWDWFRFTKITKQEFWNAD